MLEQFVPGIVTINRQAEGRKPAPDPCQFTPTQELTYEASNKVVFGNLGNGPQMDPGEQEEKVEIEVTGTPVVAVTQVPTDGLSSDPVHSPGPSEGLETVSSSDNVDGFRRIVDEVENEVLHSDKYVTMDREGVTIHWYYMPFGKDKTIPYSEIRAVTKLPLKWSNGLWRLWGSTGVSGFWLPLDPMRINARHMVVLDVGEFIKPCWTAQEDILDEALEVLRSQLSPEAAGPATYDFLGNRVDDDRTKAVN